MASHPHSRSSRSLCRSALNSDRPGRTIPLESIASTPDTNVDRPRNRSYAGFMNLQVPAEVEEGRAAAREGRLLEHGDVAARIKH